MTQEDKQLLLKDLCARQPWGVKVQYNNKVYSIDYVSAEYKEVKLDILDNYTVGISDVKPYLRPMSSMTEEEFVYFMNLKGKMLQSYEIKNIMKKVLNTTQSCGIVTQLDKYSNKIDWLNANQFDYRGLIPKGLAIKVTKENNSYKK